jgi:hypothetical protein
MGVSEYLVEGVMAHNSRVGTPLYLSPELVKNHKYD